MSNMSFCPICGSPLFDESQGVCYDCGYDETSWGYTGTDDYEGDD